jgi:hypothetical protein
MAGWRFWAAGRVVREMELYECQECGEDVRQGHAPDCETPGTGAS